MSRYQIIFRDGFDMLVMVDSDNQTDGELRYLGRRIMVGAWFMRRGQRWRVQSHDKTEGERESFVCVPFAD